MTPGEDEPCEIVIEGFRYHLIPSLFTVTGSAVFLLYFLGVRRFMTRLAVREVGYGKSL